MQVLIVLNLAPLVLVLPLGMLQLKDELGLQLCTWLTRITGRIAKSNKSPQGDSTQADLGQAPAATAAEQGAAQLEDEIARLRAENAELRTENTMAEEKHGLLEEEISRLRAEIEDRGESKPSQSQPPGRPTADSAHILVNLEA